MRGTRSKETRPEEGRGQKRPVQKKDEVKRGWRPPSPASALKVGLTELAWRGNRRGCWRGSNGNNCTSLNRKSGSTYFNHSLPPYWIRGSVRLVPRTRRYLVPATRLRPSDFGGQVGGTGRGREAATQRVRVVCRLCTDRRRLGDSSRTQMRS